MVRESGISSGGRLRSRFAWYIQLGERTAVRRESGTRLVSRRRGRLWYRGVRGAQPGPRMSVEPSMPWALGLGSPLLPWSVARRARSSSLPHNPDIHYVAMILARLFTKLNLRPEFSHASQVPRFEQPDSPAPTSAPVLSNHLPDYAHRPTKPRGPRQAFCPSPGPSAPPPLRPFCPFDPFFPSALSTFLALLPSPRPLLLARCVTVAVRVPSARPFDPAPVRPINLPAGRLLGSQGPLPPWSYRKPRLYVLDVRTCALYCPPLGTAHRPP